MVEVSLDSLDSPWLRASGAVIIAEGAQDKGRRRDRKGKSGKTPKAPAVDGVDGSLI